MSRIETLMIVIDLIAESQTIVVTASAGEETALEAVEGDVLFLRGVERDLRR